MEFHLSEITIFFPCINNGCKMGMLQSSGGAHVQYVVCKNSGHMYIFMHGFIFVLWEVKFLINFIENQLNCKIFDFAKWKEISWSKWIFG